MAYLDKERGCVVVRIVYDGPPLAGKTTSLRALGAKLGREVYSGEEQDGRTLFFDWMDYVGGAFDGHLIRCQAVTVPGQEELWARRKALIESADAIIFVADSQTDEVESAIAGLERLRALLPELTDPAPGIVFQANKRDLESAVPLLELRTRLARGAPIAITESVASEGQGIRETFVLGVQLALDRVRELVRRQALVRSRPDVDSPAELMDHLRKALVESPETKSLQAQSGGREELSRPVSPTRRAAEKKAPARSKGGTTGGAREPLPPAATAQTGLIWPPVSGRVILHEAEPDRAELRRLSNGGWADFDNPLWLLHSPESYAFSSLEEGRTQLIEWARWHSSLGRRISSSRCIVLSRAGEDTWRLWQIVQRQESISTAVREAFESRDAPRLARIIDATSRAVSVLRSLSEAESLTLSTDTVGLTRGKARYIGLVPSLLPTANRASTRKGRGDTTIDRELNRLLQHGFHRWPAGREKVLSRLQQYPDARTLLTPLRDVAST